jgi:hypothetical protein
MRDLINARDDTGHVAKSKNLTASFSPPDYGQADPKRAKELRDWFVASWKNFAKEINKEKGLPLGTKEPD